MSDKDRKGKKVVAQLPVCQRNRPRASREAIALDGLEAVLDMQEATTKIIEASLGKK